MKVVSFLKANECPACKAKMVAIEQESELFEVDEEGNLTPYFNSFDAITKKYLYCPECNKEYNAIVEYGQIRRRELRIKPLSDTIKKKPSNPFYGD